MTDSTAEPLYRGPAGEAAAFLWPTTEPEWSGGTMSDAIEENTGD